MKKVIVAALFLALAAGFTAKASAAEPGRPLSQSMLANLGLGGTRMMSDDEGLQVRGMSIAIAMGVGAASFVYTDSDPLIVSDVQMTAYGSVDTGKGVLIAKGSNEGAIGFDQTDPVAIHFQAWFGGSSFAKSGSSSHHHNWSP